MLRTERISHPNIEDKSKLQGNDKLREAIWLLELSFESDHSHPQSSWWTQSFVDKKNGYSLLVAVTIILQNITTQVLTNIKLLIALNTKSYGF